MVTADSMAQLDSRVIDLMAGLGADLTASTEVNHYLYFPSEDAAEKAGNLLKERGFETYVGEPMPVIRDWCLLARHTISVSESMVGLFRGSLERLAAELGGKYDGWEALVEPEGGQS